MDNYYNCLNANIPKIENKAAEVVDNRSHPRIIHKPVNFKRIKEEELERSNVRTIKSDEFNDLLVIMNKIRGQ